MFKLFLDLRIERTMGMEFGLTWWEGNRGEHLVGFETELKLINQKTNLMKNASQNQTEIIEESSRTLLVWFSSEPRHQFERNTHTSLFPCLTIPNSKYLKP